MAAHRPSELGKPSVREKRWGIDSAKYAVYRRNNGQWERVAPSRMPPDVANRLVRKFQRRVNVQAKPVIKEVADAHSPRSLAREAQRQQIYVEPGPAAQPVARPVARPAAEPEDVDALAGQLGRFHVGQQRQRKPDPEPEPEDVDALVGQLGRFHVGQQRQRKPDPEPQPDPEPEDVDALAGQLGRFHVGQQRQRKPDPEPEPEDVDALAGQLGRFHVGQQRQRKPDPEPDPPGGEPGGPGDPGDPDDPDDAPLPLHARRLAIIEALLVRRAAQNSLDIDAWQLWLQQHGPVARPSAQEIRYYTPKLLRFAKLSNTVLRDMWELVTGHRAPTTFDEAVTRMRRHNRGPAYSGVLWLYLFPLRREQLPMPQPGANPEQYAQTLRDAWEAAVRRGQGRMTLPSFRRAFQWRQPGRRACDKALSWDDAQDPQKLAAACQSQSFLRTPAQQFARFYLSDTGPFKGWLLYQTTGSGKTCAALSAVSGVFENSMRRVIWCGPGGRTNEYLKNVFDKVCSDSMRAYKQAAGGELHLDGPMGRMSMNVARHAILTTLAPEWFEPLTYVKLVNLGSSVQQWRARRYDPNYPGDSRLGHLLPTARQVADALEVSNVADIDAAQLRRYMRDPLFRAVVVIDEAHKVFGGEITSKKHDSEQRDQRMASQAIRDLIHHSYEMSGKHSCRVILLTATPLGDRPHHFFRLMNLLEHRPDARLPEDVDAAARLFDGADLSAAGRRAVTRATAGRVSFLDARLDLDAFAVVRRYTNVRVRMSSTQFDKVRGDIIDAIDGKLSASAALARMQRTAAFASTASAYKFDKRGYERVRHRLSLEEDTKMREGMGRRGENPKDYIREWAPKIAALIANIRQLDAADRRKYAGKAPPGFRGFKHAIYVGQQSAEGGNLEGVKIVYSALMENGFHNTFRLEGGRYPVLDLGSPSQRDERMNMVMLAKTAVDGSSAHTGSLAWKERVVGLSDYNACDEGRRDRIRAAMAGWDRVRNSASGRRQAHVLVNKARGAVNFARVQQDFVRADDLKDADRAAFDEEEFEEMQAVNVAKPVWTMGRNGQFNLPDNKYGELIRFMVFDSNYREGVDFFDVRHLHVFDCPGTKTDLEQVVGRCLRRCGSQNLPVVQGERRLNVYEYTVVPRDTQIAKLAQGGGQGRYKLPRPDLPRKWKQLAQGASSLCEAAYLNRVDQQNAKRMHSLRNMTVRLAVDRSFHGDVMGALLNDREEGRLTDVMPTLTEQKAIDADFGDLGAARDLAKAEATIVKEQAKLERAAVLQRRKNFGKDVAKQLRQTGIGAQKALRGSVARDSAVGRYRRGFRQAQDALIGDSKSGTAKVVRGYMDAVDATQDHVTGALADTARDVGDTLAGATEQAASAWTDLAQTFGQATATAAAAGPQRPSTIDAFLPAAVRDAVKTGRRIGAAQGAAQQARQSLRLAGQQDQWNEVQP